jgi:integrase
MRGGIQKRGKDSWQLRLYIGLDEAQRKQFHVETFKGTRAQAEIRITEIRTSLQKGDYVPPSHQTLGEYLATWLKTYAKTNVTPRTFQSYEGLIRNHVTPALGSVEMPKLANNPLMIQSFYATLTEPGTRRDGRKGALSRQSILNVHRVLNEALSHAVKWQIIARNPCDAVSVPSPQRPEIQVLDVGPTIDLIEAARGTYLCVPIAVSVNGGLRRGEVLGLKWSDLNWETGALGVARSVEESSTSHVPASMFGEQPAASDAAKKPKRQLRIKETKGRDARVVTLSAFVVEMLREHLETQSAFRQSCGLQADSQGWIFPQPGKVDLWPPSAFSSTFFAFLRRRGLRHIRFHDLRHTAASQGFRVGMSVVEMQMRLGHKRASTTLDFYGHLLGDPNREVAEKLEKVHREEVEKRQKQPLM